MIILGFSEFLRNIKRNILIIIQMVAVYIIAIFTISAFEEQYRLIDGVSGIFDETGMIIFGQSIVSDEFVDIDELEDMLVEVEAIDYSICYNVLEGGKSINITASNPKNISYRPELIEGQWCEDAKHEEGVINVVVSNNMPLEYKVGEKLKYGGLTYKVTGVVDTQEMIYGINNGFDYVEASYLSYYSPIYALEVNESYPFFIASYDDLMKYGDMDYSYATMWGLLITVDFEDDITAEQVKENIRLMTEKYGHTQGCELFLTEDIYNYSWDLIMTKIMPMIMLLVVIVIVLIVSLIISGAINILYERKNYGIYFICGNKWSQTIRFSLVNWAIMAVMSLVIAGGLCVYIDSAQLFDGLILSFTGMHIMALAVITLFMLVITMTMPFIMLRKIQPVSILKENDK